MQKPFWLWALFLGIVGLLLVLDLGVLHKKERAISARESIVLSIFYLIVSCLFGLWVGHVLGKQAFIEYFTGYVLEKSLSVDNIFVMSFIFSSLSIPRIYQHRVLFWGVLGVIVFRGFMIGLGIELIRNMSWILYVFGIFLVFTGAKMFFIASEKEDIQTVPLIIFMKRYIPLAQGLHDWHFWVKENGKWVATPLFLALVIVEFADLIFAVDSVPAILAVTRDPYIVYTSNIFAILGLRSLYFALSSLMHRFAYLKYALALILVFIGGKIFLVEFGIKISAILSLTITLLLLFSGMLFSVYCTRGANHGK